MVGEIAAQGRIKLLASCLWVSCVWAGGNSYVLAAVDFERDVRPILVEHCSDCHGASEQNGGLRLDDASSLSANTDSGKVAITPGQPQASELVRRVTSGAVDERMPPEGPRLSESQVGVLTEWIRGGAPWPTMKEPAAATGSVPGAASDEAGSRHWAFEPIRPRARLQQFLDSREHSAWEWNEVDRFIEAEHQRLNLQVTNDAPAHALVRRVAYTLTGLPPTPQQISQFEQQTLENGDSRSAQKILVDQLLSQPTYGERWGRHWMDWVRYADTAGDNSDYPIPQAYLYRNYVIDAINQDVPYDRFLTEQLAGDLLPADNLETRNHQHIATGYLALARRFGSLVERYPWHLTIEDTIDNVGRTMLGLTISCARCHDHKFDPISTRDYYGLYGIFNSTRYPMPGLELFKAQQHFVPLVEPEQVAAVLAPHQSKLDQLTAELNKHLQVCEVRARENAARQSQCTVDEQRRMNDELDALLLKARKAGEALAKALQEAPEIPTAYAVQDGQPGDAPIQIKGEPTRPGAQVPRKFLDVLGGQQLDSSLASRSSGRLQLAQWITHPDNPLTARVIVNRIWQRHFGTGLVGSTSDFGVRGERPSHPELLDWLAHELIHSGWSWKHIHRLILNSHTYQLSSADVEDNLASDPANAWYWKANRQRLDAESLRDTLLWLGGTLDTAPQAEPHPFPPMKDWGYTQHHPFKDDYPSSKRSVYLMTKRLTAKPYFQTFDGPDPNVCTSQRDQSVTALQALYFVNDNFVHSQADGLAARIVAQCTSQAERIDLAFQLVLGRSPSVDEAELCKQHLAQVQTQPLASDEAAVWASLVRSLLRLNEFLYID